MNVTAKSEDKQLGGATERAYDKHGICPKLGQ